MSRYGSVYIGWPYANIAIYVYTAYKENLLVKRLKENT